MKKEAALTDGQRKIYEDAQAHIEDAIKVDGSYSNNIVGATLRTVSEKISTEFANALIDDYDLTNIFGIDKVKV